MNQDLKSKRVMVTTTSFGKTDPTLRPNLEETVGKVIYNPKGRPLSAEELIPLIGEIDGLIAGLDHINASVIHAAKKLKVISRYGIGVDRVDLKAAAEKGIVVTNTPGANSSAVAELTIGFILGLARNLCVADAAAHRGEWPRFSGVGLRGKTVGLMGLGSIGRAVASRLEPFGCRILACDPVMSTDETEDLGVRPVSKEELLSQADFISLHVPATPETIGMIDKNAFNRMKEGVYLINTARGELIDEAALKEALDNGRLKGAALDVFKAEPLEKNHFLLRYPQVILTPHMAAHTDEAMNQMGWSAMKNCLAVLRGERPEHVVNPEVYI
ncbi:MAG TPA: phosphoglycerate dehydrogenase [Deltaproteobacteria bacterium]|nr:phosphoglycerate dehydrogenase [Deltaproteobacteria bacterium]